MSNPEYKLVLEKIKEDYNHLEVDTTDRGVCPFCLATHENSFQVTRHRRCLKFICWRASCGEYGIIHDNGGVQTSHELPKKAKQIKPFKHPTRSLHPEEIDLLHEKYGLTRTEVWTQGFRYCDEMKRLVMPTFDVEGNKFGVDAKQFPNVVSDYPKSIFYFDIPNFTKLHFPRVQPLDGPIVLVEDIPSAARVVRQARCCAILGSEVSDKAAYLLSSLTNHLILALDPDAIQKAVKAVRRHRLLFRHAEVKITRADPKDMSDEEISREILK